MLHDAHKKMSPILSTIRIDSIQFQKQEEKEIDEDPWICFLETRKNKYQNENRSIISFALLLSFVCDKQKSRQLQTNE